MRTSELHNELVEAVLSAGAVSPLPLCPEGYEGENADAIFVEERALVEVKSVHKDHAAVVELERRLEPTFKRWRAESTSVIFGSVTFKWDDYPEWMQHEIEDAVAPRIVRQLRKANRQFRETKDALQWSEGYGIAAFILPTGFNLDPWAIGRIGWNQLVRRGADHFPDIDAVIIITVPVEDQPASSQPLIFVPMTRRNEPVPHNLSARIRDAWFNHFARKSGRPVAAIGATSEWFAEVKRPPVRLKFEEKPDPQGDGSPSLSR